MPVDPQLFKSGMRCLASGVAILTTGLAGGQRFGLTATALSSVTADPPTLLCCINRSASCYEAFANAEWFGVNLLAEEDVGISDRFAKSLPPEERFALGSWHCLPSHVPVLASALASFECRRKAAFVVGTHLVLFGEIESLALRNSASAPLVYAHGQYACLQKIQTTN